MQEEPRQKRTYTKRPKDVSQAQKLACKRHLSQCKKWAKRVTNDIEQMLDEYEQFLKIGPTLFDLK